MTASPTQSTQLSSLVNLPEGLSPDFIDTLPVLSAILSRLRTLPPSATTTSVSPAVHSPSQRVSETGPLSIKDIPSATDDLKHKLQRARAQVKEIPDIERSLAEQDEEIRELEEKIRKQREVLEGLRQIGLKAKKAREAREGEQGMEGIES